MSHPTPPAPPPPPPKLPAFTGTHSTAQHSAPPTAQGVVPPEADASVAPSPAALRRNLPCPFCGATLTCSEKFANSWQHPAPIGDEPYCIMFGHSLGEELVKKRWSRRVPQPLYYEVIEGYPVFNLDGQGTLAVDGIETVNQFINYFKEKDK